METKINGRLAEFPDWGQIVEFQIACAKETEGKELDPKKVEEGVKNILEKMHSPFMIGNYFVLESEEISGKKIIACFLVLTQFSDWNNLLYFYIESVYIIQEFRGSGLFPQMLSLAKNFIDMTGMDSEIRLMVHKNNTRMQHALGKLNCIESPYITFVKQM